MKGSSKLIIGAAIAATAIGGVALFSKKVAAAAPPSPLPQTAPPPPTTPTPSPLPQKVGPLPDIIAQVLAIAPSTPKEVLASIPPTSVVTVAATPIQVTPTFTTQAVKQPTGTFTVGTVKLDAYGFPGQQWSWQGSVADGLAQAQRNLQSALSPIAQRVPDPSNPDQTILIHVDPTTFGDPADIRSPAGQVAFWQAVVNAIQAIPPQ